MICCLKRYNKNSDITAQDSSFKYANNRTVKVMLANVRIKDVALRRSVDQRRIESEAGDALV